VFGFSVMGCAGDESASGVLTAEIHGPSGLATDRSGYWAGTAGLSADRTLAERVDLHARAR
jgi:hypothetical protein